MKIKIHQIRTYDDAGFRRRAACLCFKSESESEILLVSSSRRRDMWIVPGGGVEPGEDPATTAVREVNEEAGVVGKLGRLLDVFENKERNTRTYVYVLVVEELKDEYDDATEIGRIRRWFTIQEADRELREHKPVQREYIKKLIEDQDHQRRVSLCANVSVTPLDQLSALPSLCMTVNTCKKCCNADREYNRPSHDTSCDRINKLSPEKRPHLMSTTPTCQINSPILSAIESTASTNVNDVTLLT